VAKLRAQTEAANAPAVNAAPAVNVPQTIATLVDDHHDF